MEKQLVPELNLRMRLIVLGVLLAPLAIKLPSLLSARNGVVWVGLSCLFPLMLTGTYRVSRIVGDSFDSQFFFSFVPMSRSKCKLPGVVYIHTSYKREQTGWGTFVLFGPVMWLLSLVFDYLIPCLGGPYEIWLETAKGRHILAWNGYNQQHFETNLEMLQNQTGAEIRLR